ncbi:MAG: T9SS type A sorting domain-containing protein, partial [Bacteroidota bacterium]
GDGHDSQPLRLQISGYDASLLFSGGNGDGHDSRSLNLMLAGYDATGIFSGGDGDGHDMAEFIGILLPLTLLSFEAIPHEKYVLLKWITTNEEATDYFMVERSQTGQQFSPIPETVDAAGFSEPGEALHYELRDELPLNGTSYYRLKSVDLDGTFLLSALREVYYSSTDAWDYVLFPNPNDGHRVSLRLDEALQEMDKVNIQVFDATGRQVLQQQATTVADIIRLSLPDGKLAAGSYAVRVSDDQGRQRTKVLLVKE